MFAAQPRQGQGRFLHGEGEENIIQRVYLLGDGVEKVSALFRAELRIGRKSRGGGFGGGGGFCRRGLVEAVTGRLTVVGAQAEQRRFPSARRWPPINCWPLMAA